MIEGSHPIFRSESPLRKTPSHEYFRSSRYSGTVNQPCFHSDRSAAANTVSTTIGEVNAVASKSAAVPCFTVCPKYPRPRRSTRFQKLMRFILMHRLSI